MTKQAGFTSPVPRDRGCHHHRGGSGRRTAHDPAALASRARKEKLIYWHQPTFTPLADGGGARPVRGVPQDGRPQGRRRPSLRDDRRTGAHPASERRPRGRQPPRRGKRLYESYTQLYRAQGHMLDVTDPW